MQATPSSSRPSRSSFHSGMMRLSILETKVSHPLSLILLYLLSLTLPFINSVLFLILEFHATALEPYSCTCGYYNITFPFMLFQLSFWRHKSAASRSALPCLVLPTSLNLTPLTLFATVVALLGRFIAVKDANIRYLGLEAMTRLARSDGPKKAQVTHAHSHLVMLTQNYFSLLTLTHTHTHLLTLTHSHLLLYH